MTLIVAMSILWLFAGNARASDRMEIQRLVGLEYPPMAAQARIEGTVELQCTLNSSGEARLITVVSGNSILAESARRNLTSWRFRPETNVSPESRMIRMVYVFRLRGQCSAPRCTSAFSFEFPNTVTVVTQARHWTPVSP